MATIIFVPFPEFGHVNPTLKLAGSLKRANHRVGYLGLADFEDHVRSQGLEYFPVFENRYPKGALGARAAEKGQGRLDFIVEDARQANQEIYSHPFKWIEAEFEKMIRDVGPDLLIVDVLIGGIAYKAATEFGIRSALLSVTLLEGPMLGVPPAQDPERLKLPLLVLCPKEFDVPGVRNRPTRFCIEASIDLNRQEVHPFPWHALDAAKPLIYCSLGSEPHLYDHSTELFRSVIQAIGQKPEWQLAIGLGHYLDEASFGPIPDNVLLVKWAPQMQILQRTSIMITHGGLGSVKECIFCGVPMIVFPCRWDQPFNAARVVAHGLGVRGNIRSVTPEQVLSLIDTLTDNPSFKRRVEAMSNTFRKIEDSGIGRQIIEKILAERPQRTFEESTAALPYSQPRLKTGRP